MGRTSPGLHQMEGSAIEEEEVEEEGEEEEEGGGGEEEDMFSVKHKNILWFD